MFGLKYFAEMRSKYKEVMWRMEIADRYYTGAAEQMKFNGTSPLSISWEKRGDDFFVPVKGSEATIKILCEQSFKYLELFTSDPRRFRVTLYRNQSLYWRGYIVADLYSENFEAPPYEVSIKAVDGFNILGGVPFRRTQVGRRSLWELLTQCFDLLELDLTTSDWLDMHAMGMNESQPAYTQAYVDMDRFFEIYEKATYRDVLEFCLKPFASQIFQSNGSLHIRRIKSLYSATRPLSFYATGGEYPSGWLITADGRDILTHDGQQIITDTTRDRIDSLWESDINLLDESTLEIVPAIRTVTVSVDNENSTDISGLVGIMNKTKWTHNEYMNFNHTLGEIRMIPDASLVGGQHVERIFEHSGFAVKKGIVDFEIKFDARINSSPGVKIGYFDWGFKLVTATKSYSWNEDGEISPSVEFIEKELDTNQYASQSIKITEIPEDGKLVFFMRQPSTGRAGLKYYIKGVTLKFNDSQNFDEKQTVTLLSNPANNVDMEITIPISHIPPLNSNEYIYPIFLTDSAGVPLKLWVDREDGHINTLTYHIARTAMILRASQTKMLSGPMFTGKHIDMNTILKDDIYLHAGFSINSMVLNALVDEYVVELVEMPALVLESSTEELSTVASVQGRILSTAKCGRGILLLMDNNSVLFFDSASGRAAEIYRSAERIKGVFESENGAGFLTDKECVAVDSNGVIAAVQGGSLVDVVAFFSQFGRDFVIEVTHQTSPLGGAFNHRTRIATLEYGMINTSNNKFDGYQGMGVFTNICISDYLISYHVRFPDGENGDPQSHVFDTRLGEYVNSEILRKWDGQILSISDYWMVDVTPQSKTRIYKRNTVEVSDVSLMTSLDGETLFADQTPAFTALSTDSGVKVWSSRTNQITALPLPSGETPRGVHYVNGSLYIICSNKVYKYMK